MDKDIFLQRLVAATEQILELTPIYVINSLPHQCLYFILPNCSNDVGYGTIGKDEEHYPEDSKLGTIGPVDTVGVVDFLCRNNRVPQWIDANAHSVDEKFTYIRLACAGRFVGDSRKLYHEKWGIAPFQSVGPYIPSWVSISNGEKFDLNSFNPDLPKP